MKIDRIYFIKLSVMTLFFLLSINNALSFTGVCESQGGTHIYNFNLGEKGITGNDFDTVGHVEKNAFRYSGGIYTAKCDIDSSHRGPLYVSSVSPLEQLNSSGGVTWFKLNDYLSISFKTFVSAGVSDYIDVPFVGFCNKGEGENDSVWTHDYRSGGSGIVSIRVDKKFVGFSSFNTLALHNYLSEYKNTAMDGPSVADVFISGKLEIPQSCDIDSGTTIVMDFGNIGSPLFPQAGAGNKPQGVNPKTHAITLKCKNIDAQAMLSMRLEADDVAGNAMVSDNRDVGFVVADGNRHPLTPNNIDSKIKFQLDDNSAAMVPITAWPVSITGKRPAEGKFTAEGYLRVDFD